MLHYQRMIREEHRRYTDLAESRRRLAMRRAIVPSRRSFLLGLGAAAFTLPALAASDLSTFANGASGASVRATLNTLITRFQDIVNVKDWGAVGDGVTNDTAAIQAAFDFAFGTTAAPHAEAGKFTNKPVFFPNGEYIITAALTIRSLTGGYIFGAGRQTTKIRNSTGNGSVIVTNGMTYSRIEGITFGTNGTGAAFDLDWDNTGTVSLQGNTFKDCMFTGNSTTLGFGLKIGATGFMGSENICINCHFDNVGKGVRTLNGNALQNSVLGGNFQNTDVGIHVGTGSVTKIDSVGFQNAALTNDIRVENSVSDTYSVLACRSESVNCLHFHAGPGVFVSGFTQLNATAGGVYLFYEAGTVNLCTLEGCYSQNGVISNFSNGRIAIRGGGFGNANFIPAGLNAKIVEYLREPLTVATLPAAQTALKGVRMFVTDATQALTAGIGAIVAGGGANNVPVICDGTNWRIGG